MSDLINEQIEHVFQITLNRTDKNNAFDDQVLSQLLELIQHAQTKPDIRAIVLLANGRHFSAGADLNWMKRMAEFNEDENKADSMVLAEVMYQLHHSSKPTIAAVQGAAFGGGAGLVAACDMAIAADNATFCFSEVKLGLIPAVISPYVVKAIGSRAATWLFTSAEVFDAQKAMALHLIQSIVTKDELHQQAMKLAQKIASNAPDAVKASKKLVFDVTNHSIDQHLVEETASRIAKIRVSKEAQMGMKAFLNKQKPVWD